MLRFVRYSAFMKVAIAQIAPVFLDRVATLERVLDAAQSAGAAGARLVAFGETLVPAYPLWLSRTDGAEFDSATQKDLHALYLEQAVSLERGDLAALSKCAVEHSMSIVLGVAERPLDRGGHSIFCTRVFINEEGDIVSSHRKLMPTYEERLAWAPGDGAGLVTHNVGEFTVGALNCWENWMPLARAALYGQGENLHVMLWPGCQKLTEDLTRFVAREGRSFVLSASALIRASDLPETLPHRDKIVGDAEGETLYDGGSCVAGPDGEWIVPPVVFKEGLLTAELDLDQVRRERQNFDPSGHYARPDVLRLSVNRRRHRGVEFEDEEPVW